MNYIINGHNHEYETQTIIQVFCPNEKYLRTAEISEGMCVSSQLTGNTCETAIYSDGKLISYASVFLRDVSDRHKEEKRRAGDVRIGANA